MTTYELLAPRALVIAAIVSTGAVALHAQAAPPTRTLAAPDKTFEESFTSISSFRELADGRVIVADAGEKTLRVFDPRTGSATAIGRQGGGPGEWGMINRLFRMPGDSTLMSDFVNGRFFVIGPDAKPATTFRVDAEAVARAQLLGVDDRGRIVYERMRLPAQQGFNVPSTGIVDVLRLDRKTGRVDTLAQFERVKGEQSGARTVGGGMVQRYTNLPLAATDVAALAFDGRVAIARGKDSYRLDWVSPEARLTRGPSVRVPDLRVTQAEKDAFIRGLITPGQIVTSGPIQNSGGGAAATGRTAGGAVMIPSGALDDIEMTWPAAKPPFLSSALQIAPDGRAWVLRSRAHDDPIPSYDVFDAMGRLVERVVLPKSTRLVGFGKDAVYLARTDEDDLLTLERHKFRQ